MDHDDVFSRRWVLSEDELLRLLWSCHAGENPDVLLLELHAQQSDAGGRRHRGALGRHPLRATRHVHRGWHRNLAH